MNKGCDTNRCVAKRHTERHSDKYPFLSGGGGGGGIILKKSCCTVFGLLTEPTEEEQLMDDTETCGAKWTVHDCENIKAESGIKMV